MFGECGAQAIKYPWALRNGMSMRKLPVKKNLRKHKKSAVPQFLIGIGLVMAGIASAFLLANGNVSKGNPNQWGEIVMRVDYPAPELQLVDLTGQAVDLKDYDGQVVLLNNWATWCPPCREEMPALQAYHTIHHDKGFSVVAVEAGDPPEQVRQFVDEYELTFPIWIDANQQALAAFRNMALPNSYVIDRKGQVRLAWNGAITLAVLEKYITPLLEE